MKRLRGSSHSWAGVRCFLLVMIVLALVACRPAEVDIETGAGEPAEIGPAETREPEFAEQDETAEAGGGGHDPILLAQAFPLDFTVEAGDGEGSVIVDMAFANEHRLEVRMVQEDGRWHVRSVRRMEVANPATPAAAGPDRNGWLTVADVEHGFSFQIPPGWVAQEQKMRGPGMPDDWPALQQYLVMPQAMAEELGRCSSRRGTFRPLVTSSIVRTTPCAG